MQVQQASKHQNVQFVNLNPWRKRSIRQLDRSDVNSKISLVHAANLEFCNQSASFTDKVVKSVQERLSCEKKARSDFLLKLI